MPPDSAQRRNRRWDQDVPRQSPVTAAILALVLVCAATAAPAPLGNWRTMKYGFFVHYVWDGAGRVTLNPDGSSPASIDDLCDRFDAQAFADDIASMGVEYLIFTVWHANMYPLFPSASIERVQPGRSPRRDLVGDVIDAVKGKGIRVFLYTHPEQPVFGMDYQRWNDFLNDLYGEVAKRYGSRIDGLLLDENSPIGDMHLREDFPRLERTIRSRAPHLVLMQNFYGNLYCADVGIAERTSFTPADSLNWGLSAHQGIIQVMSQTWSAQVPRGQKAVPFTPEGMFRFTVLQAGTCLDGGGIAWAAGPYAGGGWEDGVLETMQKLGQYVAAVARSIKHTYASTSYPTPPATPIASLQWGVATRSVDDRFEYIHVLKPPAGRKLNLPPPADGKVFGSPRLLPSACQVEFGQDDKGLHLALPQGEKWSPLDTVIALKTVSVGGPGLVNDTSSSVRYSGRGWRYSKGRSRNEYLDDVHFTSAKGDSSVFSFEGTAVELLVSPSAHGGRLLVSVDGGASQVTDLPRNGASRKAVFVRSGLAPGRHSLHARLLSGQLILDGFRVTEDINDTDGGSVTYGSVLTLNDTDTAVTYVGNGWGYSTNRDWGELNADIHYTTTDGDYFVLTFEGTGVEFLSNRGPGRGAIDFFIDDKYHSTADASQGFWARNRLLAVVGLPYTRHTLKGVKRGGTYMDVDMFRVYVPRTGRWEIAETPAGEAVGRSLHTTEADGDYFEFVFTGTGVDFLSRLDPRGGTVEYFVDNPYVRRYINHYRGSPWPKSVAFSQHYLANGRHVLVGIKKSGSRFDVDAFRVYK